MSNTADKVQKSRKLAGRVEVTSLFSNNNDYQVVRQGELTGKAGFTPITLKSVEDLNLTENNGADGSYIKKVKQEKGNVTVTVQPFDTEIPESEASNINVPTTKAVKDYVDSSIQALDVASVGSNGSYLKTISETDGLISATAQTFDTSFDSATDNNAPTTLAVQTHVTAEINKLDVASVGSDGSYLKTISETDGKISTSSAAFDTAISNNSTITAPTTNAVKTYVDNSIDALDVTISGMAANKTLKALTETNGKIAAEFQDISIASSQINDKTNSYDGTSEVVVTGKALKDALATLDVASVGQDGSYLKIISETDGKISASAAAFDTNVSYNSAVTAPTTNAVKTYVDNHASNTSGHANATTTANGFMSATDKSNLDTLVASFNNDDANTTIDSIKEVLKAFENAPEATNIVNALAGKSDTTHIHGNISKDGTLSGAKMVVVTDGDYKITTSSNITITELDCLDGVTSNIQTQLDGKVDENAAITGATKCKITYDSKGLVTAGADLVANDIPSLATSKITSGTFADERIASAAA